MDRYLLETEAPGETRVRELLVLTEGPLVDYLRDLIEDTAHGAIHPLISGVWRWEGFGETTSMEITQLGERREGEVIGRDYQLHVTGRDHDDSCPCGGPVRFVARIDAHVVDKEP